MFLFRITDIVATNGESWARNNDRSIHTTSTQRSDVQSRVCVCALGHVLPWDMPLVSCSECATNQQLKRRLQLKLHSGKTLFTFALQPGAWSNLETVNRFESHQRDQPEDPSNSIAQ